MAQPKQARPLSVMLISFTYPPVIGGSEIEVQRVCAALIARGYRVHVVCAGGGPMPRQRDWIDPKGIPVRIYAGKWNGRMKDIVFALRVAGMLIRNRHDYDLVYFLMEGLHLAAGLPIAKVLKKPILMKIAGSGVIPSMSKSTAGRIELDWLRRWARCIMILNEGMRYEAIEHGLSPRQLLWMPNPVDTDEFAPCSQADRRSLRERFGIPVDAAVLLYCGRLALEKALPSLLDAFAEVVRQIPQAILVLVGDGECRHFLDKHAKLLNVAANIRFTGRVDPAEVPSWLKVADVFALVSPAEGFPCAVLEAMSTGVACVVSNIAANRQLISTGEHGLLTRGEPHEIAAAILRLLTDPSLRTRMGELGRKRVIDNYATSYVVDRYEALFRSMLEQPNSRFSHLETSSGPQEGTANRVSGFKKDVRGEFKS